MKNKVVIFIFLFFALMSCNKEKKIYSLDDLNDQIFGVLTGTIIDALVSDIYPNARFGYYNTTEDAILAMRAKKVDAVLDDEPNLRIIAAQNRDLRVLEGMLTEDEYALALSFGDEERLAQVNQILSDIMESGVFSEILERWFPGNDVPRVLPDFDLKNTNGTLIFGTSTITEPFSYLDENGNCVGIDIELGYRIASALEMDIEVVNMQFGALISSLVSHRVDMIGACITITPERAERILFTQPIYKGGIGVIVRK